jgi:hypothetical protein
MSNGIFSGTAACCAEAPAAASALAATPASSANAIFFMSPPMEYAQLFLRAMLAEHARKRYEAVAPARSYWCRTGEHVAAFRSSVLRHAPFGRKLRMRSIVDGIEEYFILAGQIS